MWRQQYLTFSFGGKGLIACEYYLTDILLVCILRFCNLC